MPHTKIETTEATETTVTESGPQGSSTRSHAERAKTDENGIKTTTSEDHESADAADDQPAEVDASMPPGGTYS